MLYGIKQQIVIDGGINMKIKQQNQIKTFLIEEFGVDNGNTLFEKQEKILNEIIKNTKNKSPQFSIRFNIFS